MINANIPFRSGMLAALALFVLATLAPAAAATPKYTLVDLGTLGGSQSRAYDINASGQVAGWSHIAGDVQRAFLWTPGGTDGIPANPQMKDLGTHGGLASRAWGINDHGHVVGEADTLNDEHAFLYNGVTFSDLGTLGGPWSFAYEINNAGRVVGGAAIAGQPTPDTHAFKWTPGGTDGVPTNVQMKDLGIIATGGGSHYTYAQGVNASDVVVGYGDVHALSDHAFRYTDSGMTDISPVGSAYHYAWDINDAGWIAGEGNDAGNTIDQAWRFDGSSYTFLGTLGGTSSDGYAINLNGEVVGRSRTADTSRHAFIYTAGQMFDLNELIPPETGWTLIEANGMNNQGQIVGMGTDPTGQTHAFLLTPDRAPGDTDYDGDVDLADLGTLASNYDVTLGATWDMGNFDGDGDVDLADLGTLASSYGGGQVQAYANFQVMAGVEVPEPASSTLVLFVTASVMRRRGPGTCHPAERS